MSDPARQIAEYRREMAEFALLWRGVAARSVPGRRSVAEAQVFNQMVVALQARFGADLSPRGPQIALEVRLLAEGVLAGGRFPSADRWRPEVSVTGYVAGDKIALSEEVFTRLGDVFLKEAARLVDA